MMLAGQRDLVHVHHRKNVAKSFVKTIPVSAVSCTRTVYSIVENLSDKFSAGQKENTHCVPTEKKYWHSGGNKPQEIFVPAVKILSSHGKRAVKVCSYKITAIRLFPLNGK